MELNELQRLAIATAAEKVLQTVTSSRDTESLRAKVDSDMRALWEKDGVTQRKVKLNGVTVGTYSVRTKPAETIREVVVTSGHDFVTWLYATEDGHDLLFTFALSPAGQKLMMECVADTLLVDGILPDGCKVVTTDLPERWGGTTLRGCRPSDVALALGNGLQEALVDVLELPETIDKE